MNYGIGGDLTVLLNGVKYESPQEEGTAVAKAFANLFDSTRKRDGKIAELWWRPFRITWPSGLPVSGLLTTEEIADKLVSKGIYQSMDDEMGYMSNILTSRKLKVAGGPTYVWEKKAGEDIFFTPKYQLRRTFNL